MAYDWYGRNLYIGNRVSQTIEIVRTQGPQQFRATILSNDQSPTTVAQPIAIALDPDRGWMFWLDQGGGSASKRVLRAEMDGKQPLVVVSQDIQELDHLALDTINQRIYFSEAKSGRITAVNYDGSAKSYVLNDAGKQPRGLAFIANKLYYADSAFDHIRVGEVVGDGQVGEDLGF